MKTKKKDVTYTALGDNIIWVGATEARAFK